MNFVRLFYIISLIFATSEVTYSSDTVTLNFITLQNQGETVIEDESEFAPADDGVPQNIPTMADLYINEKPPQPDQITPLPINIEGDSNSPLNIHPKGAPTRGKSVKQRLYKTCEYGIGTDSQPYQPIFIINIDGNESEVAKPTIVDKKLKIILQRGDILSFLCEGENKQLAIITDALCDQKEGLQLIIWESGNRKNSEKVGPFSDGFACYDLLLPIVHRETDHKTFRIGYQYHIEETEEMKESVQSESLETVSLAPIRDGYFTSFSIRAHGYRIFTYHKINGVAIHARQKFQEDLSSEEKEENMWLSKCEQIQELDDILSQDRATARQRCHERIKFINKKNLENQTDYDEELAFDIIQLVPHQDMILIREKYATFYYTNIIPLWHLFHCTWSGLEEMIRFVAREFKTEAIIYTGRDSYESTDLGRTMHILWKVYYDPKNRTAISFVLFNDPTLTREQISDEFVCLNICNKMYWYVGNNDPQTGYVMCCDVKELKEKVKSMAVVNISYDYIPCGYGKDEAKTILQKWEDEATWCKPISELTKQTIFESFT